jgi:hypothetical protein
VRLFALIDFHHFVLALFLGGAAALATYLAFRYGGRSGEAGKGGQAEPPCEEYPEGIRAGNNPVPPVLLLLFLGFVVWFVCYVIFFGILGDPL